MRVRITYTNSAGRQFDMTAGRFVRIKTANFHNWAFTTQATALQYGDKVRMFKKAAVQYNVEIYVTGSKAEREAFTRSLHEAASYDIFENKRGVLQWGDWRLNCNIISSSTYPHDERSDTTVNDLIIYAPRPFWYELEEFDLITHREVSENGLNFPFNFPFNFTAGNWNEFDLESHHYRESEFVLTVKGPASSPRVTVNGHPYQVYANVPAGQKLIIDSQERTVTIGGVNHFADRRKDYSIFDPIPAGELVVTKSADFDAILALKYERNEPTLWT